MLTVYLQSLMSWCAPHWAVGRVLYIDQLLHKRQALVMA